MDSLRRFNPCSLNPLVETTLALAHEAALPFFPVFGLFMRRESQFWNILQRVVAR